MGKEELRRVFLSKRKFLSESEYQKRCALIRGYFEIFFKENPVSNVHVFLPIVKQREIDTWMIIAYLQKLNGVNLVVSKSNTNTNDLKHYILEKETELKLNKWGIPEPENATEVQASFIDMVLIPLITFDRVGMRIGYGKGYYDKFLSACKPSVIKLGLSIAPPVDRIDYIDEHDIAMNHCITPLGVYSFP